MIVSKKQLENLKGWVKDLESGKYKQCKNRMMDHKGQFCCLGVGVHRINPSSYQLSYQMPERHWMEDEYGIDYIQCRELSDLNDESSNFEPTAEVIKKYIERATVK